MSEKPKQFPLSLSAVVERKSTLNKNSDYAGTRPVVRPQTAMQNIAQRTEKTKTDSYKPTSVDGATGLLVSDRIRQAMVARVAKQGVSDSMVLEALEVVPRHLFVDSGLASQAYIDASLPIGHHQTISQPYIVARMIEVMRNGQTLNKVLEIGTGCGYQAAVIAMVAKDVYSIERIKALHELAKTNLRPMRIPNIRLHYGDGMLGLPQVGRFDGIILAAAGMEIPQALLLQLNVGGRLVAPVGVRNQVLKLGERVSEKEWRTSELEHCHFVPLHSGVI